MAAVLGLTGLRAWSWLLSSAVAHISIEYRKDRRRRPLRQRWAGGRSEVKGAGSRSKRQQATLSTLSKRQQATWSRLRLLWFRGGRGPHKGNRVLEVGIHMVAPNNQRGNSPSKLRCGAAGSCTHPVAWLCCTVEVRPVPDRTGEKSSLSLALLFSRISSVFSCVSSAVDCSLRFLFAVAL